MSATAQECVGGVSLYASMIVHVSTDLFSSDTVQNI